MVRPERERSRPASKDRDAAVTPASSEVERTAKAEMSDGSEPEVKTPLNAGAEGASKLGDAPSGDSADDTDSEGEKPDVDVPLELDALIPEDAAAQHHNAEDRARDLALVKRVQAGDHGAFRELFDRYNKRVFAVAFGVLKNRQDAADCVQEGFVKVYKHLPNFQGTSSFYTWLYRIVMNLAIDQLRRRKTSRPAEYDERRESEEPGDDAIMSRMMDENPRKTVIRRELVQRMEAALAELPEYHRQVILLREVEGMSYEEMAETLEVPKGTIMSRLFHARKKMQESLRGYIDGDLDLEE
jgi:RNA polymerase sigma-70 factor (ECF subfamily)